MSKLISALAAAFGGVLGPALGPFLRGLRGDWMFWILFALAAGLSLHAPDKIAGYPKLVDWSTIASLAGLLLLTKAVESSGALEIVGRRLIRALHTQRRLALGLVSVTALLSMLLTNDVALFVVVPLTLGLNPGKGTGVPVMRLVIFEALAVNAGSALTPIGNPQNLFLWQLSGTSFHAFMLAMLPPVLIGMGLLLVLTAVSFSGTAITVEDLPSEKVDRKQLGVALALYLPFLVLTNLHHSEYALLIVLALFLAFFRSVVIRVDWGLILVFVLMFVDLRLLAQFDFVRQAVAQIDPSVPQHLFLTAIAASQVISNVPGAILLAEYSRDWRIIAFGVNVGGFGFMVGSLANLIALRMARDSRTWLVFHAYSVPFLLVAGALTYVWLFWI